MDNFDIFGQIGKEVQSFSQDSIFLAGTKAGSDNRYLQRQDKGWNFNQSEMINLIELYYNSKFETGETDSEGYRKLFLNKCAFRADVAAMRTDLDVKDFVFIPDDQDNEWGTYFVQKRFRAWARENFFGEFINDLVENFPKYGTLVVKRVGKKLERVPLKNLVNQQDAKDLKTATHVIELHKDMTLADMKQYPDWDTSGLDMNYDDKVTVYERYGRVPANWYYQTKGIDKTAEYGDMMDVVVICTMKTKKNGQKTGTILFCEEVKDRPYEEVHWKRVDGRWLGVGEVENQLENQLATNTIANLRRRALLWSSRKVFQSADDTVAKNLIKDVRDGAVLKVMPNGQITQVDMASRALAEFNAASQEWEQNSDQKSFTYEVATGESLPSGTPFRLGVVLSNAINSHFGLKREKLGLFLKRLVLNQVFEIFKKDNRKEHTVYLTFGDKGINDLKKRFAEVEFNKRVMEWAMGDDETVPDFKLMRQLIEEEYDKKKSLFIKVPAGFYDNIKFHMELELTGEAIEVGSKIETYTTLYQTLLQAGDPRASQILNKIVSLTGDNLESTLGPKPEQAPIAPQQPQQDTMNQLAQLNAPQQPQVI